MAKNKFRIPLEDFKKVESEKRLTFMPEDLKEHKSSPDIVDRIKSNVNLVLRYCLLDKNFLIRGSIKTAIMQECARCIEPYSHEINAEFYNIYARELAEGDEEDYELQSGELEISIVKTEFIDLLHVVLEQIILQLPLKPLCNIECKGLCHVCGQDLNKQKCSCNREVTDARFEVLKKLLPTEKN